MNFHFPREGLRGSYLIYRHSGMLGVTRVPSATRSLLATRRWSHVARGEVEVKKKLKLVKAPGSAMDVTTLGAVQGIKVDENSGIVNIDLNMGVPGHPHTKNVIGECQKVLSNMLPWVREVSVRDTSISSIPRGMNGGVESLANIEHVIAVSSCKGGVGKSTAAVNLALTLARRGLRVGLVDADVYGPSLPLMLKSKDSTVRKSGEHPNWVVPLTSQESENLKFLSFGHVNPKAGVAGAGGKGAAIMRGPVVSRVINQLVTATEWGNLDYLIVDMPPGTGDIQITLTQSLSLTGSVVITTPHPLSTVDASKGLQMFDSLHVPVLALVENMSYFKCDQGKLYHPFGKGGKDALLRGLLHLERGHDEEDDSIASVKTQIESCPIHQFPLTAELSGQVSPEQGEVYQLPHRDTEVAGLYDALADDVLLQIAKQNLNAIMIPSISFDSSRGIILRYFGASSVEEFAVPCWQIRDRDPLTGDLLPAAPSDSERKAKYEAVEPVKFDTKGNYGVSIVWSDGHYADIFPFEVLRILAERVGT